jgi:hypothetical protein
VLYVVTSVQAALLAASISRCSFFFRLLLPLVDLPLQPRFLASATFLAALRSARLALLLRLGTRRVKLKLLTGEATDAGTGGTFKFG